MKITVENLRKTFGDFEALSNVSLEANSGEFVALLGPSGSGKTTLLRNIAGLDFGDRGRILFDGAPVSHLSVGQRRVGFVFQNYALFKHLNVFENIAFGLRVRPRATRPNEAEIRTRVDRLLRLVQIEELGARFPDQISGGQRQRVALARALAIEPRALLLDEPFGALDAKVRKELRRWLRGLQRELKLTTIFVTHDQDEALEIADRVAIMNQGKIEQIGTPAEVYDSPASPFVFEFLGDVNRVFATGAVQPSYVRPHDIEIGREPGKSGDWYHAVVCHLHAAGPVARIELERMDNGAHIHAQLSRQRQDELQLRTGDTAFVRVLNAQNLTDGSG
ncbi:sulfate ABC transporter ATP-binding protein [Verrucomicrobia bacterium SCGC AG-212-E04]|nr:sulfate ABC transporter ATP-binding protein [Verrucomicrobia bacterium SCGC AG-212-E04]